MRVRMMLRMARNHTARPPLQLVFDTPTRAGLARMATRLAEAQLGRGRAVVHVHDAPGQVHIVVAIGWRAWLPWVWWRLSKSIKESAARTVAMGVEPHVNVCRRLPRALAKIKAAG